MFKVTQNTGLKHMRPKKARQSKSTHKILIKHFFYGTGIVTLPPQPPRYINFFEPFHYLAGDQLVVPIGASHISLPLQEIQSREREKKRERMNNMLGVNSRCRTRSYVTLYIPVSIYRLTLAWISSENSTTLLECQLILTRLPSLLWTSSHPTGLPAPVSTGHSRDPSPTAFLELLCPTLWLAFSSYFRSPEMSSPKPFVWFRTKTDKGIVFFADHLHSVTAWSTCNGFLLDRQSTSNTRL